MLDKEKLLQIRHKMTAVACKPTDEEIIKFAKDNAILRSRRGKILRQGCLKTKQGMIATTNDGHAYEPDHQFMLWEEKEGRVTGYPVKDAKMLSQGINSILAAI